MYDLSLFNTTRNARDFDPSAACVRPCEVTRGRRTLASSVCCVSQTSKSSSPPGHHRPLSPLGCRPSRSLHDTALLGIALHYWTLNHFRLYSPSNHYMASSDTAYRLLPGDSNQLSSNPSDGGPPSSSPNSTHEPHSPSDLPRTRYTGLFVLVALLFTAFAVLKSYSIAPFGLTPGTKPPFDIKPPSNDNDMSNKRSVGYYVN